MGQRCHGVANNCNDLASSDKASIDDAVARIKKITFTPEVGGVYTGVVKTIMPYGVFVGFEGGKDGLLHVSEMSHSRIDNVEDVFSEGDEVTFKIVDIDERTGKLRLSRKAIMPRADGTIPTDEDQEISNNNDSTEENQIPIYIDFTADETE